jgi:hypothetical protein
MSSDERRSFLPFCSFLLILSLGWRLVPSLRVELQAFLLLLSIFAFLLHAVLTSGLRPLSRIVLAVLIPALVALGLSSLSRWALGLALVVVLFVFAWLSPRASTRRTDYASLMLTAFLFQFYMIASDNLPGVWYLTVRISRALSSAVSGVMHIPTDLGPSSSCINMLALFLCSAVSLTLFRKTRKLAHLTLLAGALLVMWVVYMGLFAGMHTIPIIKTLVPGLWPAGIELLAFGLLCIPLYLSLLRREEPHVVPTVRRPLATLGGLLLLLACGFLMAYRAPLDQAGRNVLIFDPGYINFSAPVFGAYGDKSGGMFGNFPRVLRANGFATKRDTLTADNLNWANVLVIINPVKMFRDSQVEEIHEFLSRGGSLLALGDHTGFNAIREPFNQILSPLGVEFNFDCGRMLREGWVSCMQFRPHYVTAGLLDENFTQIWTGASLSLRPPAEPLILGQYAFSDEGNLQDKERSYLGDLVPNPGEQLGDVVLVAQTRCGKGKVLAYGDTSTFQNGALVNSYELAIRSVLWLAGTSPDPLPVGLRRWLIWLSAVASLALLLTAGRALLPLLLACAFFTVPALLRNEFSGSSPALFQSESDERLAGIDAGHTPIFDMMGWNETSIGGLSYNLMRNGLLPLLYRKSDPALLRKFDVFIVVGSRSDFKKDELEALEDYVRKGGVLLICEGYEEYAVAPRLLKFMGFRIDNIPLGPQEGEAFGASFTLYRGYPARAVSSDAVPLSFIGSLPLLARRDIGLGTVFVIGDSSFLLNKNLESRDEFVQENIMFLRAFLTGAASSEVN